MRILLDYRPALRERTGVGEYVHGLASGLLPQLAADDTLVLFSSSLRDRLDGHASPAHRLLIVRIPVRILNFAWHRLEWPPIEMLAGPVDVAHAAHPLMIPVRSGVRVITVYDLDFLDHPERTRAEIRRDYPPLVPQHAQRADLVVTISQYTAAQTSDRLGVAADRIVVCRPGAPAAARRAEPKAVGPILFVGTIEPRKNLDVLFRAYARVLSNRPDTPPLLLVGRTVEQSAAILEPLSTAPLAGHARHLGYVDAACPPSTHGRSVDAGHAVARRGFRHSSAGSDGRGRAGRRIAAGCAARGRRRRGLLVDATDDAAFAAAIEALLSEPQRRVAQAEAGVLRAREFSWKDSAAQLLAAYRAAFDRQRGVKARLMGETSHPNPGCASAWTPGSCLDRRRASVVISASFCCGGRREATAIAGSSCSTPPNRCRSVCPPGRWTIGS